MRPVAILAVGAATAVAVGLLSGEGWPLYLAGAVLALALWVMLFLGSYAGGTGPGVPAPTYALAALLAVVLGAVMFAVGGGENGAWWAPGFIMSGAICSTGALATRSVGRGRDAG